MAKTIASEIERVKKNGASVKSSFSSQDGTKKEIRHGNMNGFKDGDVFTLPTSLENQVYEEPMKRRGEIQTNQDGEPIVVNYMFVNVTRTRPDGSTFETPVQFYPSSLQKMREKADAATKAGIGEYVRAEGDVVEMLDTYDDYDSALTAIAAMGKQIRVTLPANKKGFPSVYFDQYTASTNIYDFNFC